MEQKNVYIVLTRTTTVLSRLIAYITGDSYSHASIALERELPIMYSFGRRWRYNAFIGGFCTENINKGLFADCKVLPYAVVKIPVTQQQHEEIAAAIEGYIKNARRYHYNYVGLVSAWFGKPLKFENRFYCSEFVYNVLWQCEVLPGELPDVIRPVDFLQHGEVVEQGRREREERYFAKRLSALRLKMWPKAA